ncbi:MAG: hypothetical protein RLZZ136_1727 [Pseudomonadota bacterium]|jgi:phenylpropionate dioxygenase-like ring-hydroxylating dioxygenase large terminal subunit
MSSETTTLNRGYADLPIPFGWFAVALSNELAAGDIRTLRYFGTEFVLWRGEDGAIRAVDPVCPHLGAHLGVRSSVIGNDLRCAYHHWSFNGDGGVVSIPYTKMVPPKLKRNCLPTWHTDEVDGVIYVWYHPNKAAPKWDVAHMPVCPDGGDWILAETHDWVINIHCQEITENGQDHAHFGAVHGVPKAPAGEFKVDGWVRHNRVVAEMDTPRGPMTGIIDVKATGPGQSIGEYIDVTHVVQVQQVTPIDSEHTHLRWQLYHVPGLSEGRLRVTHARMRDLVKQVNEDMPIWNSKIYMPKPLLVEGDGPMMAYREQYKRYYDYDDETEAA